MQKLPDLPKHLQNRMWKLLGKLLANINDSLNQERHSNNRNGAEATAIAAAAAATADTEQIVEIDSDSSVEFVGEARPRRLQLHPDPNSSYSSNWHTRLGGRPTITTMPRPDGDLSRFLRNNRY